jgi:glycerol kinase
VWRPSMDPALRAHESSQWNRAVEHALGWVSHPSAP